MPRVRTTRRIQRGLGLYDCFEVANGNLMQACAVITACIGGKSRSTRPDQRCKRGSQALTVSSSKVHGGLHLPVDFWPSACGRYAGYYAMLETEETNGDDRY